MRNKQFKAIIVIIAVLVSILLFTNALMGQTNVTDKSSLFIAEKVKMSGQESFNADTDDAKVALLFFAREEGDVAFWLNLKGEEAIMFFDFFDIEPETFIDSDGDECTKFFLYNKETGIEYYMLHYNVANDKHMFIIRPKTGSETHLSVTMLGYWISNLNQEEGDKL